MSDRLNVATRKGLFTLERAGKGWEITDVAFLGEPVTMVLPDARDGSTWAALNLGHFGVKLHRRGRDGSWREVSVPQYPEQPPPDPNEKHPDVRWSLVQIWSLEAADPSTPGTLWAGTIPGGLFRSDDGGESWSLIRSLWDRPERRKWFGGGYDAPGIHSVCVDPRDPKRLTVGISCGGVWRTEDGGESWETRSEGMFAAFMPESLRYDPDIQDPHRVVQCASAPDTYWAQHHNGVFVSTDDAAKWRSLEPEPSVFGFAVAVHPKDPKTAWLVPAVKDECRVPVDGAVVVNRTRDGGDSFETLREGLPQKHAYDLVFRHALDVDETGERLAFGSTTGSLWTTDDGGDSWQAVSHHLPPVYAVRFGEIGV